MDDLKQFSIRMSPDLHRRLKIIAAREGMTIQKIINGLVDTWVTKKEAGR